MATKMHIENRFPCSAKTLMEVILSPEFDQKVMDEIGMKKEYLEQREVPKGLIQKIKMIPSTDVPGFMKKIVGKANYYIETREWDYEKTMNTWFEKTGFATSKTDISGTFVIHPEGENTCRRTVDGTFSIKIPLVGKKIEKFVIKQTEQSFVKATEITLRWLKEMGLEGK